MASGSGNGGGGSKTSGATKAKKRRAKRSGSTTAKWTRDSGGRTSTRDTSTSIYDDDLPF